MDNRDGVPATSLAAALRAVSVIYRRGAQRVHAATDVTIEIPDGRIVGLIGESGAGKSTVLRVLLGLTKASQGTVEIGGTDLASVPSRRAAQLRHRIQVVMQNPYGSLDPRWTVARSIAEPLRAVRGDTRRLGPTEIRARVAEMLDRVHLPRTKLESYPRQLSGGERQRVAIARALAVSPRLLVADEPVTALDNVTTAQILGLLEELHRAGGLAILLVSHSMSVIGQLAQEVHVMRGGRIVESGATADVLDAPRHPHTAALVEASRYLDDWSDGSDLTPVGAR